MKWMCIFLILVYNNTGFAQGSADLGIGKEEAIGISGTPYFLKDWSDGVIRFTSGRVTDKFKLKFNNAQNRLMLQFNGSTFAAESKVNEFVMYTKNKKDSFVFRKGFPATARTNAETFYQVLDTGRATLLGLYIKEIVEEKSIYGPKPTRHYNDLEEFFVLLDGTMHKIDRETKPLSAILSDHWPELMSYIAEHHLKLTSAEDLAKVVRRYNELAQ